MPGALLSGEPGEPHLYSVDGGLPDGVEAVFPGREPNDACGPHDRAALERALA